METMAMFSPYIYAPFYLVAIYAFLYEKEWIRAPGESTILYLQHKTLHSTTYSTGLLLIRPCL